MLRKCLKKRLRLSPSQLPHGKWMDLSERFEYTIAPSNVRPMLPCTRRLISGTPRFQRDAALLD